MTFDRPALRRSVTVSGPCPADEAWDRYVRPRRWPEWSPQIRSVDYPSATLTPGTSGVVHGPAGVRVPFKILKINPLPPVRSWSWAVSAFGVRLRLSHTVEAVPAGTRTGLTVEGFAPAVLSYLPLATIALRRLTR